MVTGDDKAGQYKNFAVRTALLWKPSDGVSFKLAYQHSEDRDNRPYATNALPDAAGNPMSIAAAVGGVAPTTRGEVANSAPTRFNSKVDGVFLTATVDLGGAELKSYSMYRKERTQNFLDLELLIEPGLRRRVLSQEQDDQPGVQLVRLIRQARLARRPVLPQSS